jgi:hypothetical protein
LYLPAHSSDDAHHRRAGDIHGAHHGITQYATRRATVRGCGTRADGQERRHAREEQSAEEKRGEEAPTAGQRYTLGSRYPWRILSVVLSINISLLTHEISLMIATGRLVERCQEWRRCIGGLTISPYYDG